MTTRFFPTVLLAGILLPLFPAQALPATTYERTIKLPPARLSQKELAAILTDIHVLVSSANALPKDFASESVTLGGDGTAVSYDPPFDAFPRAPAVSDECTYSFSLSRVPISHVLLMCRDEFRTCTVQGEAPQQVDGLCAVIQERFGLHGTIWGGAWTRGAIKFLAVIIMLAAWTLFMFRTRYEFALKRQGIAMGLLLAFKGRSGSQGPVGVKGRSGSGLELRQGPVGVRS